MYDIAVNKERRPVYKITESIMRMGNARKTEWLYKIACKGLVSGVDSSNAVDFADTMDSMISVLKVVFKDKWDIHLHPVIDEYTERLVKYRLYVKLHYPLINIVNSDELQHTIKDLFVLFEIENNGVDEDGKTVFSPGKLMGTRSTLSYEEWFGGYKHSHLPSHKPRRFSDALLLSRFCTGHGEIEELRATLRAGHTAGVFELFLLTLETMVSWESLEGRPHMYIKEIGIGKQVQASNMDRGRSRTFFNNVRPYIFNNESLDVNFIFSEDRYKIKTDAKFEQIVKDIVINNYHDAHQYLLVLRQGAEFIGYNFPNIETPEELRNKFLSRNDEAFTLVQGREFKFKVEPFSGEMPDINKYRIHPKFLNYAATRLEQELYTKSVRKSAIERHYQAQNA